MNDFSKRKLFDLRTQIPIMQLVLILQDWHNDFRLLTTYNCQVVHARLPSIFPELYLALDASSQPTHPCA